MSVLLSLGNRQNLAVSPRMQQAIRLLRLSAVEFEASLREAVETNPFLETGEDDGYDGDESPAALADDGVYDMPADTGVDAGLDAGIATMAEAEMPSADPHAPTDGLAEAVTPAADEAYASSELLPESFAFERHSSAPHDDDGPQLGWVADRHDLRDYLRQQLLASQCSARELEVAGIIIDSLDDDGYLRDELNAEALGLDLDEAPSAEEFASGLKLIRSFDPPGVGARTLVECLQLQLAVMAADTPGLALAQRILGEHLDVLARRDFYALRRRLQCDEETMRTALALIRSTDPDPASRFSGKTPDYVIPDVIVQKRGERFVATINPAVCGNLRLNDGYISLFRSCRRSQHPLMSQQLQEARWFVRNVVQRHETILRVASYIVEQQQEFFRVGDIALRPMVLREVAGELGLHESTISRATGNKYLASPRGCFEFKHFFSRELQRKQGASCSAASVRTLIQGLISTEQRDTPLSDVDIAAELQSQGITIARRTVTKYRRMMKLPPAEFRKVS